MTTLERRKRRRGTGGEGQEDMMKEHRLEHAYIYRDAILFILFY
jgi:hypothetical protein